MKSFWFFVLIMQLSARVIASDTLVVADIRINGNLKTKASIIFREMTFSLGDKLSEADLQDELERTKGNIMRTNLFIWVKHHYYIDTAGIQVEFEVKERLYLLPLPIFYLADRNFNEWWYNRDRDFRRVVYGLQLHHSNLTGNGDELKLKTYGGFIPHFELSYARPYLDKAQKIGVQVGVFYSMQKTFPYRTWADMLDFLPTEEVSRRRMGAYGRIKYRQGLYHFHTLYSGYISLWVSDSVLTKNPDYLMQTENRLGYWSFHYDYSFDQRDNAYYPLNGRVLTFNVSHSVYNNSHLQNRLSLGLEAFKFISLGRRFYADIKFRGQLSLPKRQLYPFISGLGFRNAIVRGYELNVIDGQHYGIFQSDLKYQVYDKILDISKILKWKHFNSVPIGLYARIFYDAAYVQNFYPQLSKSTLSNRWLNGFGAGVDLVTFYDTVLKLNYSVSQFGQNKLYFGVQRSI